jgi:molybdopterin-containing oxidoreductase family membrane subunit
MSDDGRLPYGVGRFGPLFVAVVVVLLGVIALAVKIYAHEYQHGIGVTEMKTLGEGGGASWGLYITMYIYFVGISLPGITLAAVIRLFRLRDLEPLARAAELLAVITVCIAASCILVDLGRPLHGLWLLPKFARPMSPFFGTFTLVVAGYLFASFVFLYLTSRRDAAICAERGRGLLALFHRLWALGYRDTAGARLRSATVSWWLALLIIPVLVVASSTLGWIFGLQVGRPGWYGTLQAPAFVVLAGVSGIGLFIVLLPLMAAFIPDYRVYVTTRVYRLLGTMLWVLSAIYLYFAASEFLTVSYASGVASQRVEHALTHGDYAVPFYTSLATLGLAFLLPFLAFLFRRWSLWLLVPAGICANVGALLRRYLLVASSQTHGSMLGEKAEAYIPGWGEITVMLGVAALGVLGYLVALKLLPIGPVASDDDDPTELTLPRSDWPRVAAFWLTLVVGISLTLFGFLNSSGDVPRSGLDYAPVIFIVGVVMCFTSAIVYEVIPEPRTNDDS